MRAKVIVVLTFFLFSISSSLAGTQKVLYTFTGGTDGGQPYQAGVVFDTAGNLYGVTQFGGANNLGTVFQLTPSAGGAWTETVLHSFTGVGDGEQPQAGLAIDGAGNLYGTTSFGGDPNPGSECGTVFELSPSSSGWTFAVLHTFTGQDGCSPQADLSFWSDSYLLGTTAGGGLGSEGTAFGLSTSGTGHAYASFEGTDGNYPGGMNSWGYGTTYYGGKEGVGNVFEPAWGDRFSLGGLTSK
ncbi:MAG: choice-of-anchor tandem repeat GloVer-containing protein [Terriglobales bacterium]